MHIAKSKVGPSKDCDAYHPDQSGVEYDSGGGQTWFSKETPYFDGSPFEHLSTWSYLFSSSSFLLFFLFSLSLFLSFFHSSMSPLARQFGGIEYGWSISFERPYLWMNMWMVYLAEVDA